MDAAEVAVEEVLKHHGIKGMKWGIRKASDSSSGSQIQNLKPEGVTMRRDGSIDIKKGSNIQRLSHSDGKPFPMKDLTYASINAYDTSQYIKELGGGKLKGFTLWGGSRDQVLGLQTTQRIKAPSREEAIKIHSAAVINNPEFRKAANVSSKRAEKIAKDPTGKTAQIAYDVSNRRLINDKGLDSKAPELRTHFVKAFQDKGYNAVRDEWDAGILAVSPIAVFHPEKTLKVTTTTDITTALRKQNKETLKLYKTKGKAWVERELYGERK